MWSCLAPFRCIFDMEQDRTVHMLIPSSVLGWPVVLFAMQTGEWDFCDWTWSYCHHLLQSYDASNENTLSCIVTLTIDFLTLNGHKTQIKLFLTCKHQFPLYCACISSNNRKHSMLRIHRQFCIVCRDYAENFSIFGHKKFTALAIITSVAAACDPFLTDIWRVISCVNNNHLN